MREPKLTVWIDEIPSISYPVGELGRAPALPCHHDRTETKTVLQAVGLYFFGLMR